MENLITEQLVINSINTTMKTYNRNEIYKSTLNYFNGDELATNTWINKYALKDSFGNIYELNPNDTHKRLAKEIHRIEQKYANPLSDEMIFHLLDHFKYLVPGGGSLTGIGNEFQVSSLSNCFAPGTKIYTSGGVKNIEEVQIGDLVNTQTGELKPVVQLHKNQVNQRTMFDLKVYKTPKLTVTDNHKFLSISKEQLEFGLPLQENTVEYLRVGDYIAIPKQQTITEVDSIDLGNYIEKSFEYETIKYSCAINDNLINLESHFNIYNKACGKQHKPINRIWRIDMDFMYFIGLWYGDGCVFSKAKTRGIRNRIGKHQNGVKGITFTFGSHEIKLIDFVINYGQQLFGIDACIHHNVQQHVTQIVFHSPLIGIVFEKLFGRYSFGKQLNPIFFGLKDELVIRLTQGLIDSDGTVTKNGDVRVVLSNRALIQSFYHLLRNRGIVVGYSETTMTARLDFVNNSRFGVLSNKFYNDDRIERLKAKSESKQFIIEYGGYTLLRINNKTINTDHFDHVYTLGIEDIHSYSVEGLISMNCFVVGNPYDSYGSIFHIDEQQVQLMKRRGGVGHDLSHIRPSGTPVKNSALTSTGIVPFMERYSNSTREVAQDGRRGALMLSLSIKHPDSEKFIDAKLEDGKVTGANISVKIGNDFMNAVIDDKPYLQQFPIDGETPIISKEIDSKRLWNKIIHNVWKSAEPGVLFWDKIISESPADCYADQGYRTVSTNPCFPGSEYLLTENGYYRFQDLCQQQCDNIVVCDNRISYNNDGVEKPENWIIDVTQNGTSNRKASPVKITQLNAPIVQIKTSKGFTLKCTPDHHIATTKGMVEAKDINIDHDILIAIPTHQTDSIVGQHPKTTDEILSLLVGLISGDGTGEKTRCRVCFDFWGADKDRMKVVVCDLIDKLYKHFGDRTNNKNRKLAKYFISHSKNCDKIRITSSWLCQILQENGFNILNKFNVPEKILNNASNTIGKYYIAAMMYCDGSVQGTKESGFTVRLSQSNEAFLKQIQMLLHANGMVFGIYKRRDEQLRLMPNGKGGHSQYKTKTNYELISLGGSIVIYRNLIGFLGHSEKEDKMNVDHNFHIKKTFTDNVIEKINLPNDTVYCLQEPITRSIIVNGISVRRCGEIPLCPYDSCRLLAINLLSYVDNPYTQNATFNFELFKEHVLYAQRIMDDIIDLEIEKIDNIIQKIKDDREPDYIKQTEQSLWEEVKKMAYLGRRTGLGITSEGDMLAAMGYRYGSPEGIDFAVKIQKILATEAYTSSIILAKERGAFTVFDAEKEKANPFINRVLLNNSEISKEIIEQYHKTGRRNIACLTIAPTGTVSIMTQTTSGIEPAFGIKYKRKRKINPNDKGTNLSNVEYDKQGDAFETYNVYHHGFVKWANLNGYDLRDLSDDNYQKLYEMSPYYKSTSADINWVAKVEMQGRIQQWVDHSISVTVNLPNETTEDVVSEVYMTAWKSGCKGITVYREGSREGILVSDKHQNKIDNPFQEINVPKRPKVIECDVIHFSNKGEKWVGILGLVQDRPIEIFTGKWDSFMIPPSIDKGFVIKVKENGKTQYNLQYIDADGYKCTMEGLNRAFNREYHNYARLISGVLRQGMPLIYVYELVDGLKLEDGDSITDWKSGVKRLIKRHIKDGVKTKDLCPDCGLNLIFSENCKKCTCGYTACG